MDFPTYKNNWKNALVDKDIVLPEVKKASEDDLKQIQNSYKNVPPLLIDWWKVADGTKIDVTFLGVFSDDFTPCNFYSIQESLEVLEYLRNEKDSWEEWPQKTQRDSRIKDGWLNDNWLPIAGYNGLATIVMIDNDPTNKGSQGQVIVYQHDPDAIYFVAKNIKEFFEKSLGLIKDNLEHVS